MKWWCLYRWLLGKASSAHAAPSSSRKSSYNKMRRGQTVWFFMSLAACCAVTNCFITTFWVNRLVSTLMVDGEEKGGLCEERAVWFLPLRLSCRAPLVPLPDRLLIRGWLVTVRRRVTLLVSIIHTHTQFQLWLYHCRLRDVPLMQAFLSQRFMLSSWTM